MAKLSEPDRRSHLKNLCLTDLYFLLRYPLRRADLEHPWLFARCREVQANPDGYIDLWSREARKTTIITFGLTIFDILNDPEITVGIFSHTRPIAKSMLRQIKRELETNELLKTLFPDILWENPHRDAPQWSEDSGIIVNRRTNPKEATVEAWGLVDGMPTGRHFKKRVYDDVVAPQSVTTPEQVAKTTEAFELSDNLGVEGGVVRIIGTRYILSDSYSSILKRGVAKPRLYPATNNGKMDGKPVLFSEEEWERRKKTQSRAIIAAQLLQNPLADEDATFSPLWLSSWEVRPRTLHIAITCDPSKGLNARSDNTAIIVTGIGAGGTKHLLDGYCHRMTLSQRWTALRDLYVRWSRMPGVQHIDVGYERYGAQSDDEYFRERMENEKDDKGKKTIFDIKELSWTREGTRGQQGKRTRIERLEPDFRNRRFLLPYAVLHEGKPCAWRVDDDPDSKTYQTIIYTEVASLTKAQIRAVESGAQDLICKAIKRVDENGKVYDLTEKFIQEYLYFPFGEYKDALDAASRIYDLEMRPPVLIHRRDTEPGQFFDS